MCEEASVGVSGAVTSGRGAGGPLCLEGFPVEGRTVQQTLLLSAGGQRTPVGATVRGVLPADVTQAVAARHRASAGGTEEEKEEEGRRKREDSRAAGKQEEEELKPGSGEKK